VTPWSCGWRHPQGELRAAAEREGAKYWERGYPDKMSGWRDPGIWLDKWQDAVWAGGRMGLSRQHGEIYGGRHTAQAYSAFKRAGFME